MKTQKAIFAAGCFWGVQYYFDQVPGVVRTTVGYAGGRTVNPTYDDVCTRLTGHAEALLLEFDSSKVSYETLVGQFFHMHDPTLVNSDGINVGPEYRSALFYFTQEQYKTALQIRNAAQKKLGKPIVTEVSAAGPFYEAEDYHQKYTERTGIGMCHNPYKPLGKV